MDTIWEDTAQTPFTKAEAQREWNIKQSVVKARNWLKQGPEEKEKPKKQIKKERTMLRVMRGKIVRIWSANTRHLSKKIDSVREILFNRQIDYEMIREAVLSGKAPPVIDDFTPFSFDHKKIIRGSIMYVRNGYIPTTLRIKEREEDEVSSEFMHMRLDAIPPLNVISIYQETNSGPTESEAVQKVLMDKVQIYVDNGETCVIVGDTNTAVNEDCNKRTSAAKQMLEWKATNKS